MIRSGPRKFMKCAATGALFAFELQLELVFESFGYSRMLIRLYPTVFLLDTIILASDCIQHGDVNIIVYLLHTVGC